MKTRLAIFSLALALAPAFARAATIAWPQCLSQAAASSTELAQARERLLQAEDSHRASLSTLMPGISASASLGSGGAWQDSDPGYSGGGQPRAALGLNASQNLFRGFSDFHRWSSTRAALEAARAAWRQALTGFQGRLRGAYAALENAQAALEQAKDIQKRRQDDQDMVGLRYDAGLEDKGAYLQAQSQFAQAKSRANSASRDLDQASRQLEIMLGQDPAGALRVLPLDAPAPLSPPSQPDFESLARDLPATIQAAKALDQARAQAGQSAASFLPSVNASASLQRAGENDLSQGSWSVGLSASWDLFSGGSDAWDLASSRSKLRQAKAAFEQARRQAVIDLAQAWNGYLDADESRGVARLSVQAAETRADIGRAKYTQGLLSFDNWDQIESEAINARTAELGAELALAKAWAAWQAAQAKEWTP